MKNKKILLNKIIYEKYFDSNFSWNNINFYKYNYLIIDEDFLKLFKNKINWQLYSICCKQFKLSILIKYQDYIFWEVNNEDLYCNLTDVNIETLLKNKKIANKLNWDYISSYSKLSERFIIKYKKYVNWHFIYEYQQVSNKFIKKYRYVLLEDPLYYQKNFFKRLKDKLNYYYNEFYFDHIILK